MLSDLRFAIRMLVKYPAFSIVAFLALVLGIGANTTVFGIINTLVLRPLPIGRSEQVVKIFTTDNHIPGNQSVSVPNFQDFEKQNTAFSAMSAYTFAGVGMTRGNDTLNVGVLLVTGNYFDLLQVKPSLGRTFLPEEDSTPNGHPVVVLGYKFWKKLGGDPAMVGSEVTLNGHSFTVIGVAPAAFTGVDVGFSPDLWVPVSMHQWVRPGGDFWFESRRALLMTVMGRLKPGVSTSEAQAQMRTIAKQLEQAYPDVNKERSVALVSLEAAKSEGLGGPTNADLARNVSLLLLAASASILLIACANVANLLLARSTARQREMAVRLALGAGRGRIVRQLLTESILLGVLGGVGGVILAFCLGDVLIALLPPTPFPIDLNPQPDWRVLTFSVVVAVLSGVMFGLAPALQISRWNLTQGLRERVSTGGGAVTRFNLRSALVVAQIAVSLLLLIGSGLFLKSFYKAQSIDPGFRTDNLDIVTMNPVLAGYDSDRAIQITRAILDQLRHDPRVAGADVNNFVPLFGGEGRTIVIDGRDANDEHNRKFANYSPITPGYFQTLGIRLLRGRNLTEQDSEKNAAPVAVIDETMAKEFWPNEDALGRRFRFMISKDPIEVIGIASNSKAATLGEVPTPMVYWPLKEINDQGITIFVHTGGSSGAMLPEIRRAIRNADVHIPITYEKTIRQHMAIALWPSWMGALLLGGLGLLAFILASMGVYGVMAYSVSQRTRELGIRMALGAQTSQVIQLVLRQGMFLAAIGLGFGLFAAFGSTRLAGSLLYGVNPSDPVIFVGVTSLLALAAFAACYFPARRALKINPVTALRID
ncbi:MAG TPA: ABC transporter permease [Chthoniobacterales bacterium]|nr:ABC transporter permease [Chthoniobacterales bacterium]